MGIWDCQDLSNLSEGRKLIVCAHRRESRSLVLITTTSPAEWLALSNLSHVCFGPIVRIVHGINCRSTPELRSAVRYFTLSTWAAKRIRKLAAEKKRVAV